MKKIKLITLLCAAAILFSGCIRPGKDKSDTTAPPERHTYPFPQDITYAYKTEVNESVISTELNSKYLILANKREENHLGKDYVPESLTKLTCKTHMDKEVQLESRAATALYEMLDEMHAAGKTDIMVASGYRGYNKQVTLYQTYLNNETAEISVNAYNYFDYAYLKETYLDKGLTGLSHADARKVVLSYSALPGTSEHQTGLCIDFITSTMGDELTVEFEKNPAFAWLRGNAYKFGFILRYPKGKEDITGYTYEPWHFRFVGREAATIIHTNGITLEEYLGSAQ